MNDIMYWLDIMLNLAGIDHVQIGKRKMKLSSSNSVLEINDKNDLIQDQKVVGSFNTLEDLNNLINQKIR